MGISGRIARAFLQSQLTPLIALVALLLGTFAVIVTPKEEEPQINVTMANVFIPFPGASAKDVETLVATPAEQVLSQVQGLEHIYSVSRPGVAILTVQYKVGVGREAALVRLWDAIHANRDWVSAQLGVGEPIIKAKGIDDVPIVALTLSTADSERGAFDLERVAHAMEVVGVRGARVAVQERVGAEHDGRVRAVNELGHDAVVERRGIEEDRDAADERHDEAAREPERVEHG